MKPYQQINKDLKTLAIIAIELGATAPDFHQVMAERKIKKILSRYLTKKRQYPKFNSI